MRKNKVFDPDLSRAEEMKNPAQKAKKTPEPTIPYREGTDKYHIAKALIAGETNRVKIVRELGVSINTVYNVTRELAGKGYILNIQQKLKKVVTSLSSLSHQSHQKAHSSEKSNEESSEFTQEEDGSASEDRVENLIDKFGNDELSVSRRRITLPVSEAPVTLEDLRSAVKEVLLEISTPPEVEKLPGIAVPAEDVEVVGEKINYRVKLNPEIFYRYSVFKARAEQLGNRWTKDFSDFLDMATKDVLTVHGLCPTVLTVGKSGKTMVEIPLNAQQGIEVG